MRRLLADEPTLVCRAALSLFVEREFKSFSDGAGERGVELEALRHVVLHRGLLRGWPHCLKSPCCTDRSFGSEEWRVLEGRPAPYPGQSPCHSKRTRSAL